MRHIARRLLVLICFGTLGNMVSNAQDDQLEFPTGFQFSGCIPNLPLEIAACGAQGAKYSCTTSILIKASETFAVGKLDESTNSVCDYIFLSANSCRPLAGQVSWGGEFAPPVSIPVANFRDKVEIPVHLFYMKNTKTLERVRNGVQSVSGFKLLVDQDFDEIKPDKGGSKQYSCADLGGLPSEFRIDSATFPGKLSVLFVPEIADGFTGCHEGDVILISDKADALLLMHEVGHALGLCHSAGADDLMRSKSAKRDSLSVGELAVAFLDPYSVVNRYSLGSGGFFLKAKECDLVGCDSCPRSKECARRYPPLNEVSNTFKFTGRDLVDLLDDERCENERRQAASLADDLISGCPERRDKLESEILDIVRDQEGRVSRGALEGLRIVGGRRAAQELKKIKPKSDHLRRVLVIIEKRVSTIGRRN